MADRSEKDVGGRLDALERSLRLPQKRELAAAGKEAADLRQRALQLDDRPEATALAARIATLADRGDVVIEWTARDVDPAISAAVSCCCCCCCCCASAALEAGGGVRT